MTPRYRPRTGPSSDLVNHHLAFQTGRLDAGEIGARWFEDCRRILTDFGRAAGANRSVTDLRPDNFEKYRARKAKRIEFYTLRGTFSTSANEAPDPPAIHLISGHTIPRMTGIYVREISLDRLQKVVYHARTKVVGDTSPKTSVFGPVLPRGGPNTLVLGLEEEWTSGRGGLALIPQGRKVPNGGIHEARRERPKEQAARVVFERGRADGEIVAKHARVRIVVGGRVVEVDGERGARAEAEPGEDGKQATAMQHYSDFKDAINPNLRVQRAPFSVKTTARLTGSVTG